MHDDIFSYLLKQWEFSFFAQPLIILCQILALVISIRNQNREYKSTYFVPYIISGLILFGASDLVAFYFDLSKINNKLNIEICNTIFMCFEFITFALFFKKILRTNLLNKIISIFFILLITTTLIFYFQFSHNKHAIEKLISQLNSITFIELTFIGILCLVYFFELFKFFEQENLLQKPSFWIVSSLIFYTLILPIIFIGIQFIKGENNNIYRILVSLHYISLCFVYLGITKAILCKRPLTI